MVSLDIDVVQDLVFMVYDDFQDDLNYVKHNLICIGMLIDMVNYGIDKRIGIKVKQKSKEMSKLVEMVKAENYLDPLVYDN